MVKHAAKKSRSGVEVGSAFRRATGHNVGARSTNEGQTQPCDESGG
jgi:hypothetical protein